MKDLFYTFLWIFLTAFIGFNIVVFLDRKKLITPLEAIGLSFPLGIGVISVEMFIIGLVCAQFRTGLILAPWIALIAYNCIFLRPYFKYKLSFKTNPSSRVEKIIFSFICFEVIYTFFRALIKPIESYDSVAVYALKSKMLYLAGTLPQDFFTKIANNFHGAHPDYPLLIPMAETWFYTFISNFNDFLVKSIFPIYFLSFVIVFYFILKRILGSRFIALLFTFALVSIKQFNDYAAIGMADLILGIYFCLSFFYLFLWIRNNNRYVFLLLSLLFSILTLWTKNEGLILVAINGIILLLFLLKNNARWTKEILIPVFLFFLIIIALAFSWIGYRSYLGLVNENFNFSMVSFKTFVSNFNKIPHMLYEYQKQIFGFKKWNIMWITILFLFVARFKRCISRDVLYPTLTIIMFSAGYSFMYISSTVEVKYFLTKTTSRFLLHILPLCIFWIAYITKEDYIAICLNNE